MDGYVWERPNPFRGTRAKRFEYRKGDPHPRAGKVAFRVPTAKLGSLAPGDKVYFRNDNGEWTFGELGDFEDYRSVRRRVERANQKRRSQYRAFMRRKTIWDFIASED
jgi:hypothetical protein